MQLRHQELTREQLYAEVWTTPMSQLAKRYGLTDSGLAKICRKHRIPRPPRGYWQELRAGKNVRRHPLPPLKAGERELMIRISLPDPVDVDADQLVAAEALLAKLPACLAIAAGWDEATPLSIQAAATARSVTHGSIVDDCLRRPRAKHRYDVRVSRGSAERAVRVMDQLISAFNSCGVQVAVEDDGQTRVQILGEDIPIYLTEETESRAVDPTPRQRRASVRDYSWVGPPHRERVPTGRLCVRVGDIGVYGVRRQWGDTARSRLEDRFEAVIRGLVKVAIATRSAILKRARWQNEELERRRSWEEQERLRRVEKARIESLDQLLDAWQRSQMIRAFLVDAQVGMPSRQVNGPPCQNPPDWLKWVEEYADRLDKLWQNMNHN
ncbi:MAG: hypothetical protein C0404_06680 [Verrucomicrobia bacterium]|nr:hypothetical protein [Verrucomicrobiota bacterium]